MDLGFAFLPEYEGQGYGYETANRIKEVGLNEFHIKTLNAITLPDNVVSQRLLMKLGFTFVSMINVPNDDEELMLYQIRKV